MLVFTRKIGQQVVLPDHGITIDVVEVGRTRVRLGISAPADTTVHRREVWERARGNGRPTSNDSSRDRLASDDSSGAMAPAPSSSADLGQCLALWIAKRTGGRIRRLSVETRADRIVIRGSARSFYARQLAQAAVQEVFDLCRGLPRHPVEYGIEIGDAEGGKLPPAPLLPSG
jgi:carbon storage regulator